MDNECSKGQRWRAAEWEYIVGNLERPNRANKPNRHCSVKLCTLHIKCPSVGVRTMSTARDSNGGQQRGSIEWERPKRANKPNRHCSVKP